ncbi:CoA-binding protein [Candidimonas nitroreducens]|uniref:Acyl-CoA synthetase n=1 Tax=Candidimonas nitroreducens TaxID=683354 RepID=A0A225MS01_9BURK|nr:CoA-binding protein [Candidimonas nitroreducens]OWT63998.1 acyl-CoA synthetase [Candidimonas nitroreducens]
MSTTARPAVQNTLSAAELHALFHPRAIAVAGVSSKADGQGNKFIRRLRQGGYQGNIYPIHPHEAELEGLPAYPGLAQTPEPIDYAFIAIPAQGVPDLLAQAGGHVKFAQVMSSGFGEGGRGQTLQTALIHALGTGGVRLLGPNCLGIYSPSAGITFVDSPMGTAGSVGIFSQSGGLSVDIINNGEYRGLRFSGVVSLGNCLDIGPCELLEYYLSDPQTRVIGAYLETVNEGRRFFEALRAARAQKPVVILKGGRTAQGQRAAASHTGSLAGNDRIWKALTAQTGSVLANSLEDFIDTLVAFQSWNPTQPPFDGRVLLFGNGGGASVLASDALGRQDIELPAIKPSTVQALKTLGIPPGASLDNPLDFPANILNRNQERLPERVLRTTVAGERPEIVLLHINLPVILPYRNGALMDELMHMALDLNDSLPQGTRLFLVLRSSGRTVYEAKRQECVSLAMARGIPTFPDLSSAARALGALKKHGRFLRHRGLSGTGAPKP